MVGHSVARIKALLIYKSIVFSAKYISRRTHEVPNRAILVLRLKLIGDTRTT